MKLYLATAAMLLASAGASAVNPMWVRDAKVSPDGSRIAFTYKGAIYTVPVSGGHATRLTSGRDYDSSPVWSPDGSKIAYASDRNGGQDVYIIPSSGGTSQRLTSNSAAETPEGFSPDGGVVYFSASIQDPAASALAPMGRLSELYAVSSQGGRPVQVLATPAVNITVMPDGRILYEDVKGFEDQWRKHHTSSVTRDIWIYDPHSGSHTNLTAHDGEDRNPTIAGDSSTLYFLSERNGGSMNVYAMPIATPGATPTALTSFTSHPVRFLSGASDGTLAFTYNGELFSKRKGADAVKIPITITEDLSDTEESISYSSSAEATVSPDGKQVAYTVRGEIFVTSAEYPSTKQITHTPAQEYGLSWGSDGRSLYYTSLRDGRANIWRAKIGRKDDPNFSNATLIEEECLFPSDGTERSLPVVSPDGKKIAYVSDRTELKVMDLSTRKITDLSDHDITNYRSGGFDVRWSPDSQWLTLEVLNPSRDPYGDIAVINATTGERLAITQSGYFDERPRFSADGNAVLFLSERYGMRNHASWGSEYDVMMAFLNKEAYDRFRLSEEDFALLKEVEEQQKKDAAKAENSDKKKSDKKSKNKKSKNSKATASDKEPAPKQMQIDRDGLMERIVRLTPASSDIADYMLSKDGETLYYLTAFEGGYDLWKKDLRKGDVSLVKKLDAGQTGIETDKEGNLYLIGKSVKKFNSKGADMKNVSISGKVKIDHAAEREAMLNYVATEARERFYLPEMPIDWDYYVENYRQFLPHINNNYDFAELLSELLGELNVSHSGGRYYPDAAKEPTASLGLLYDLSAPGEGLTVEEVLEKGPFDRATTRLKKGSVITAINNQPLSAEADLSTLLNGLAGKKTLVSFTTPGGENAEEVVIPIGSGAINNLLYNRWVKHNREVVDSLSGGRLGYVHIASMNDASFREVYSRLLGEYADKEGVVIDTRWNGGGRLHEDIEVLFSGEKYLTQEIHGRKSSEMPSRRWNRPSVMLICEANYSNAHGTPWVYNHKGLGKLVGMPVPGTMSSVNWITLQDPSLIFGVPVVAFRTADGTVLENTQLEPDIKVANRPEDIVRGIDDQLNTAVKSLLQDIDSKK